MDFCSCTSRSYRCDRGSEDIFDHVTAKVLLECLSNRLPASRGSAAVLCDSPHGNTFSTEHLEEDEGNKDRCGRSLFRHLHDEVDITATWRGVWEPLARDRHHLRTSVKTSDDEVFKLDVGASGSSEHTSVKVLNQGGILHPQQSVSAPVLLDKGRKQDIELVACFDNVLATTQDQGSIQCLCADSWVCGRVLLSKTAKVETLDSIEWDVTQNNEITFQGFCYDPGGSCTDGGDFRRQGHRAA